MKQIINADLSKFSGFGCGGKADILIEVENKVELKDLISSLEKKREKWYILGKGYNTLISDVGVRGTVIRLTGDFIKLKIERENLIAGAGMSIVDILNIAVKNRLGGLEFMAGIPGTVGAAVFNNAGTSQNAMNNVIREVEIFSSAFKNYKRLNKEAMGFEYRYCKLSAKDIITECVFGLKTEIKTDIIRKIKKNLKQKKRKQPVNYKSCGCIFKNLDGGKTSAAKLIESAGLSGQQIGGAQVSNLHVNYIINKGGATSRDIWELIQSIKSAVKNKYNKELELEIELLGEGFENQK